MANVTLTISAYSAYSNPAWGGYISTPAGSGAYVYTAEQVVSVVATPSRKYSFVSWTGTAVTAGKVANANSASTTVTMSADYTLIANFTRQAGFAVEGAGTHKDPYLIVTTSDLVWCRKFPALYQSDFIYWKLTKDISTWNELVPIGCDETIGQYEFQGFFEGNNYTIKFSGVSDSSAINIYYIGFFGIISGESTVQNLNLTASDVIEYEHGVALDISQRLGGFVGKNIGQIRNCTITAEYADEYGYVGDGYDENGSGNYDGKGGFVGVNEGYIQKCTGDIPVITDGSPKNVGGFCGLLVGLDNGGVGENLTNAIIKECSAKSIINLGTAVGATNDTSRIGGFVGSMLGAKTIVEKCASIGDVTAHRLTVGGSYVGGFCGQMSNGGLILNCYAKGNVDARQYVAGFVGCVVTGTIRNCYCANTVTGILSNNGFCAANTSGVFTSCYYDREVSGLSDSATGTPKTTKEMYVPSTFTGWDFVATWFDYPETPIWDEEPRSWSDENGFYHVMRVHYASGDSYQTYTYYYEVISGDASDSGWLLTPKYFASYPVNVPSSYRCYVKDEYGNISLSSTTWHTGYGLTDTDNHLWTPLQGPHYPYLERLGNIA